VDLRAARNILEARRTRNPAGMMLAKLADSCTEKGSGEQGPGAAFAVIGALVEHEEQSSKKEEIEFRWRSGDEEWARAVASEPLAGIWRRALEARQVIGSDPRVALGQASVARILAYPLEEEGRLLGTLVAGLPPSAISLATLERLELRAALAAAELGRRKRYEEEAREVEWQRVLLDSSSEAVIFLDEAGRIAASSRGARELASFASGEEEKSPASLRAGEQFAGLFRTGARERIEEWMQGTLEGRPELRAAGEKSPQAELYNALRARADRRACAGSGSGHPAGTSGSSRIRRPGRPRRNRTAKCSGMDGRGSGAVRRAGERARDEHQVRADRGAWPGGLREDQDFGSAYRETGGTCRLAGAVRGTLA